jgi:hypothetical protein
MLARNKYRRANIVSITIRDRGNLIFSKPFHCLKDKSFSGGAIRAVQRPFNETQYFVGGCDLFRGGHTLIRNYRLPQNRLIGLVKLQLGFITTTHVALAGGILKMDASVVLVGAGGHLFD